MCSIKIHYRHTQSTQTPLDIQMNCDVCCEPLPTNEPGAVQLLTPCNHRVHARCNKEGEECQACVTEKQGKIVFNICFLLLIGFACGLMLAGLFILQTDKAATLSRNIRRDIAEIEAMADTPFYKSMFSVHAVASLQRIHGAVKHELTHCRSQRGGDTAPVMQKL
jgi:hypothetical protein